MFELRTLGELTLRGADGTVLSTRRTELALLVYVLRHAHVAPTRAELAELLWPDRDSKRARHSLRQALVHLRHLLGDDVVGSGDPVRIRPDVVALDVTSFEADVAAGRWHEAAEWPADAFLRDVEDLGGADLRSWIEAERESLRLRLGWGCEQLVTAAERGGRTDEAITWAERWAAVLPVDERPQIRLIAALRAAGRIADAMACFAAFVVRLERDLGAQPSPELAAVGRALEQDARRDHMVSGARGSVALFAPALVGRDAAMAELLAAWQAAQLNRLQIVMVEGEPGVGKSRLCTELLARVADNDVPALALHGSATDSAAEPWSFARQLLAPLGTARGLGGAPDQSLAELAMLVPAVRTRYPELPRPGQPTAAAIVRVLTDVASEQPLLIVVDDLAAADETTQSLIVELCCAAGDAAILVVVTAVPADAEAIATLRALRSARAMRRIRLTPFDRTDVDQLLSSMLSLHPADHARLVDWLSAKTGGNPGSIRAAVEAFVADGRLAPGRRGPWRLSDAPTIATGPALAFTRPASSWIRRSLAHTHTLHRARRMLLLAGTLVVAAIAAFSLRAARAVPITAVIAIGSIVDHTGGDDLAVAIPDMLATSLSRVEGLTILSSARVHELHGQLVQRNATATVASAASQAGAQEVVEGELYRGPHGLRLDLRRIDLRTGGVQGAYRVEAADPFDLVDRATLALAMPDAATTGAARFADISTTSIVAYRMYAEGLRAYYDGDAVSARRLFDAAIAEDSAFAMATYYLGLTLETIGEPGQSEMLERAARLANRATDRERLLVHTAWAEMMEEPAALLLADTLAIRYPFEPDGHYFLGRTRVQRGDFFAAVPHLRRVIEMDSLATGGARPHCRVCDAYYDLILAWMFSDSLARAESVAREWTERQPMSGRAWHALAALLEYRDRYDEARAARRRAAPLQPGHRMVPIYPALIDMRAGDFAAADQSLLDALRTGAPAVAAEARWFLTISLRYQGRLHEALEMALPLRASASRAAGGAPPYDAVHEAQVLFEMGRFREAAALFDSIAAGVADQQDGRRRSRDRRAWLLTHSATARFAAGDTAGLGRLADEIEALGRRSALGRDRRLHHYLRGLLLGKRGELEEAVVAMRNAMYSPAAGNYTRISYELGRLLLELGRPHDAVAVLRPALVGTFEASNLYLSRTELRALLGHAWEAAGEPDSAAVHYAWVLRAWQQPDAPLIARRDSVRQRFNAVTATRRAGIGVQ